MVRIKIWKFLSKTLDISADNCIFQDGADRTGSTYQMLLRLLPLCNEKSLSTLVAAAAVLTDTDQNALLKEQSESIRDEQT